MDFARLNRTLISVAIALALWYIIFSVAFWVIGD